MVALALTLLSCHTATPDYRKQGSAALSEWGWPTDTFCERNAEPDDPVLDGFTLCLQDNDIVPIDDPIMLECGSTTLSSNEEVFWVFDGEIVKATVVEKMIDREILHLDWNSTPVMVDW